MPAQLTRLDASGAPVSFERDGVVVSDGLERAELGGPVDDANVDGGPGHLSVGITGGVFAMAVEDAVLGKQGPAGGKCVEFAVHDCVGGVPVEAERLDGGEQAGGFGGGCGVALMLIFEDESYALPACGLGGGAEFVVDGGAVGRLIVETPEVEAADFIGLELFGGFNAGCEDFVLLFEVGDGAGGIGFCAGLREGRSGPVYFEERAGNVGDAEAVFGEDGLCAGDLAGGEVLDGLLPEVANLDPAEAEVVGGYGAGVIEVVGDFVGDDAEFEG